MTGSGVGAHVVEPLLASWCVRHLGSPPVARFFGIERLSAVHGLRLADGREVVLKVRGAQHRQAACTVVHEAMWQAGLPCPRPLAGPAPLVEDGSHVVPAEGEGNTDRWAAGGEGDAQGVAAGGEGDSQGVAAGGEGDAQELTPGGEGDFEGVTAAGREGDADVTVAAGERDATDWAAGGEGNDLGDARLLTVNAETWEGEGVAAVGALGAAGYARLLARMVAAAPAVDELTTLDPPVPWLNWDHGDPNRVWPPPASQRWDPHRIGAEIDPLIHEVARRARARLLAPDVARLPRVAAHGDFEAQNCRWVAGEDGEVRLVIHDWDSVVAMPEAVLAGNSALTYVSVLDCEISSIEQNDEFLAVYGAERGRAWAEGEWQVAHAAGLWVGAYNAAFEHLKGGPGPVTAGLQEQAAERLRRAGA